MLNSQTLPTLKNLLLSTLFVILAAASCQSQGSKNVITLAVSDFDSELAHTQKPQLIDVRSPQEFNNQHIGQAININWNDPKFANNVASLDKSKPVFVYCLSGGRSAQAAYKLAEMGFTKIFNLQGGIMKWNSAQKPNPLVPEKIVGVCSQEYNEMLKSNKKTIVNFYADWCAPCKLMAPYILKIQKEFAGKVAVVRYNADENKTIMKELKLDELPVILIYENQKLVFSHKGFLSESDLRKQINN